VQPMSTLGYVTVVVAPAVSGKTSFAAAHFERPAIVRDFEDIKRVGTKATGIIFTYCDSQFRSLDYWEWLAFVNPFNGQRRLPARFKVAYIPNGIPVVIVTQEAETNLFGELRGDDKGKRHRRTYGGKSGGSESGCSSGDLQHDLLARLVVYKYTSCLFDGPRRQPAVDPDPRFYG